MTITGSGTGPQPARLSDSDLDVSAKTVLVIDDDESSALLFSRVASRCGLTTATALSGSAARARMQDELPDVVVLDMVMPDMDGIEMVKWLTERGFMGTLIVVSGFSELYMQAAATLARARGITDVKLLTKPISVPDLREALGECSEG